ANKLEGTNNKFCIATNALKDQAGNVLASSVNTAVLSDPSPPAFVSGTAVGTTVYLYFDENLDPAWVPTQPAFEVIFNSSPMPIDTVSISGNTIVIVLTSPVSPSMPVSVTCPEAAAGSNYIRDKAGNHLGDLSTGTFLSS
ncbi:MAG: Ig-like domain-containing protein, partial [Candidatus Saccharibacteria bacterium]